MKSTHHMTVQACVNDDGTPVLCGIVYGTDIDGLEIVGNGTLPYPLTVRVLPGFKVVKVS